MWKTGKPWHQDKDVFNGAGDYSVKWKNILIK